MTSWFRYVHISVHDRKILYMTLVHTSPLESAVAMHSGGPPPVAGFPWSRVSQGVSYLERLTKRARSLHSALMSAIDLPPSKLGTKKQYV